MLAVALLSNAGRDFRSATQPVRRPRLTWPFPVPEGRNAARRAERSRRSVLSAPAHARHVAAAGRAEHETSMCSLPRLRRCMLALGHGPPFPIGVRTYQVTVPPKLSGPQTGDWSITGLGDSPELKKKAVVIHD
jgi:hypothetical protein